MVWQSGYQLQGGRYSIIRLLGSGRFALTYLAEKQDGSQCVIKTLNDNILNQRDKRKTDHLQDKFWQEGHSLAACEHPNIVKAQKPFREKTQNFLGTLSQVCIPMEYIEGKTLDEFPLPLSEKEALKYIEQIGQALITVHNNNLLHRDIKLSNIMIRDKTDEAILIDFGLAKEFDEDLTSINPTVCDGFSPPELYYCEEERGPYTDIYSLAATLYILLTDKIPPKSTERFRIGLISPQEINPNISNRVNQAIITGMEIEKNRRPQTMKTWLEDLLNRKIKIERKRFIFDPHLRLGWATLWVMVIGIIVGSLSTLIAPIIPQLIEERLPNPIQKSEKN
ncbi:MAG: serine/threonine protein kinase [Crocosphaera sp.]